MGSPNAFSPPGFDPGVSTVYIMGVMATVPLMGPAVVKWKVGLVATPDLGAPGGVEDAPTVEITAIGPLVPCS